MLSGSKSTCKVSTLSQYSKLYVLFSAIDIASTTIDFSKRNVNDKIVDSLPSRGPPRSPIVAASPLQRSPSILRRHCSPSPCQGPTRMPHRQLCKCCRTMILLMLLYIPISSVFLLLFVVVFMIFIRYVLCQITFDSRIMSPLFLLVTVWGWFP